MQPRQVAATARLFAEGATVPFIARYRKEATGSLDEVAIATIRERLASLADLDQRREAILKSLAERNLLTEDLKAAIAKAETMTSIEDVYQPYRPKRRTRAMIAKEKGLEPLAQLLFDGQGTVNPQLEAARFMDANKGVGSAEEALAGARDILAEQVSDNAAARERIRALYFNKAVVRSKVTSNKQEAGAKFKDYFDWNEALSRIPSHRLLAIRRGEEEGFLTLRISRRRRRLSRYLNRFSSRAQANPRPSRFVWRSRTAMGAFWGPPLRPKRVWNPKGRPTRKRLGFLRTTCANFCWLLPSARRTCWLSIPVFARDARLSAWIGKASCCTTM